MDCKNCCHLEVCHRYLKQKGVCGEFQYHICDKQRAKIEILEDEKGHFELKDKIATLKDQRGQLVNLLGSVLNTLERCHDWEWYDEEVDFELIKKARSMLNEIGRSDDNE